MKLIIDIEDEALERLSTVDPNLLYTAIKNGKPYEERPKGEWVDTGDMQEYWAKEYQCLICGAKDHWHNFCPNCGADMRGDSDG